MRRTVRTPAWSRLSIGAVLALTPTMTGCLASGIDVEILAAAFAPAIRGDAGLASTLGGLSDIDLRSDLDLEDRDTVGYARVSANLFGLNLVASGFDTSQSGSGQLTAAFGDIVANSPVRTDLDLRALHGTLTFDLINFKVIRISPGIGVDYFDLDLDVADLTSSLVEDISVDGPVPLVAVEAEIDPLIVPVTLRVNASGITGDYDEIDGTMLDIEALLNWEVVDHIDVFGGYRFLMVEFEGTDDGVDFEADVDLSGFIVGAGIHF